MFFGRTKGISYIVVFLGNPGDKYANSRHNAGFMAADAMEKLAGVSINRLKFRALTASADIGGQQVLLMKPQTFMNLSGEAVGEAARFYKVPAEKVIVISDETSLPIGRLRIRQKGSAGGHNGLKNIIQHLGGENFPRIRIGVGAPPHPDYDMKDWVLAGFHGKDLEDMLNAATLAAQAAVCYITEGPDRAMNKFNSK